MEYSIFNQTYIRDPFSHTSTPAPQTNLLKSAVDGTSLWWNNIPLYDRVRKEHPSLYDHSGMKWMRRATRLILLAVFVVLAVAASAAQY